MGKYGLIGDPIATSKSPVLFEAAYRGVEQPDGSAYSYDLIEGADFEESFRRFEEDYLAVNVTAPFKEQAYTKVEELAELGKGVISGPVARIGAANLLVKTTEGIAAHNSDFTGIIAAIADAYYPGIVEEFIKEYQERFFIKLHQFFIMSLGRRFYQQPQALIVGCGGAGRAAEDMPEYGFIPDPIKDFKEAVKECDLIIYTLPMALPEIAEFTADDFANNTKGACDTKVIFEANYKNPSFDEVARAKLSSADGIYIPGERWLLYQALTGYHLMTGISPDLAAMEEVLG